MESISLETESPFRKQRLWVISELYYPEMTSTGYYLTRIAEGLAQEFDVKVVCGQPNYSARGTTAPKKEVRNGVEIYRVFGTRLDKNVIPFRLLNMLTLSLSVFLRCIRGFRASDQILVVTTPPLLPFLTGAASAIRRSEHILLIHDCYPEILYAAGKLREKSIAAKLLEFLSRRLLGSADGLIVVGRDMKERVLSKLGSETPCSVIPNWAELETVSPAPKETNQLIQELGLQDRFIFLYAGNMGYPNDIETFIGAATVLETKCPKAHFVFLGEGVKKSLLLRKVNTLQIQNITILDSRPRSDQQVFLNSCDVGIVSLVSKMKGVSMPSRTYNILAAGKPILAMCDPESEVAQVIEEEEVGWIIKPGDTDVLVERILEIAASADKLIVYSKNARNAAVEKYSFETAVSKYKTALCGAKR